MHTLILLAATTTPDPQAPTLRPGLTDDQIGPGFLGFVAMAFIVTIMFFLIRDMVRRVRRVRYRAQVEDAHGGAHGPKANYVDIPIMTDAEVRAAGAVVAENSRPMPMDDDGAPAAAGVTAEQDAPEVNADKN